MLTELLSWLFSVIVLCLHFLLVYHHPHPLCRSTIEAFYSEKPDVLRALIQHRFRHSSQYLRVGLSNHPERICHDVGFGAKKSAVYIWKGRGTAALKRSLEAISKGSTRFGCVQSLERFSSEAQAQIHAMLKDKSKDCLPQRVIDMDVAWVKHRPADIIDVAMPA